MSRATKLLSVLLPSIAALAGCGGDTTAKSDSKNKTNVGEPQRSTGSVALKTPKFESELFVTHTNAGGTGTSSGKTTHYQDGKPFSYVQDHTSTLKGDGTTVKARVKFVEHKDGADVYSVETEIATKERTETNTTTVVYTGEKKKVLENHLTTVFLQPPSK